MSSRRINMNRRHLYCRCFKLALDVCVCVCVFICVCDWTNRFVGSELAADDEAIWALTRLWNVFSQRSETATRDKNTVRLCVRACSAVLNLKFSRSLFPCPPHLSFLSCLPFDVGRQRQTCFVPSFRVVLRLWRTARIHNTEFSGCP